MKTSWIILMLACVIGASVFALDLTLDRSSGGDQTWMQASDGLVAIAGFVVLGLVGFTYARRAERGLDQIGALNDMLRAIRNVNQIIVREAEPQRLLELTAKALAETRGYECVWMVTVDAKGQVLQSVHAGPCQPPELVARLAPGQPVPAAFQGCLTGAGAARICSPPMGTSTCAWATQARGRAVCCRLIHAGTAYGLLGIQYRDHVPGSPEDRDLLTELAGDLALALDDLTETAALAKEQQFIHTVLGATGALVATLDRRGAIVYANQACEQASGYRRDELRNKLLWDVLIVPEEAASVQAMFADLKAGSFPSRHRNCWRTKDGQVRLIEWHNTALTDEKGVVEYVIKTGIDITEQSMAETALVESEAGYRNLVEGMPGIVYHERLNAASEKLSYVSPQVERYLGVPAASFLDQPWKWIHPDDRERVQQHRARCLREGSPFACQYRMVGPDGRSTVVNDRATVVRSEAGQPLFVQGLLTPTAAVGAA